MWGKGDSHTRGLKYSLTGSSKVDVGILPIEKPSLYVPKETDIRLFMVELTIPRRLNRVWSMLLVEY